MIKPLFRRLLQLVTRWAEPNLRVFFEHKQPLVWFLSVLIGLSISAAAILFRESIGIIQELWVGTRSERVLSFLHEKPAWIIIAAPTIGGLIVGGILHFFLPGKRAGGVADVIEAKAHGGKSLSLRTGLGSALATVISLGSGASAGREGPVVHLGATLASQLYRRFQLQTAERRTLLACGVAAAVSSSFNAPIAGAIFAHEVILQHYAMSALAPVVISSVMGTILSRLYFGDMAAFIIPDHQITSYWEFPGFALLGLTCAIVAICFQFSLIIADWVARHIPIPTWVRPAIGGVLIGLIALVFPAIMGVGYEATDMALKNLLPLTTLLLLLVAKTAATAITLASRFGGGVFSPSLYIGAMAGGAYGLIAASVFPDLASSQGLYSILGMAAVAASVLSAPISTVLIVFELTGGYSMSIAALLTVSIATGLTQAIHGRSFFHWQLEMRGLVIKDGMHKHLIRSVHVSDFMRPLSEEDGHPLFDAEQGSACLYENDTLEHALRIFDAGGHFRLPVVDNRDNVTIIGWAHHVHGLRYFNAALIETSEEEHR